MTSAWLSSSRLIAPQPTSASPSRTDQNVTSGLRSPSRSRACLLSSGVMASMSRTCSARNAAISGPDKSSTIISISALVRRLFFAGLPLDVIYQTLIAQGTLPAPP